MRPEVWKREQFNQPGFRHCRYCHKRLTFESATIDHVRPKSKGGRNKPKNFALACAKCNHDKADKYFDSRNPTVDPYAPDPWWPKRTA